MQSSYDPPLFPDSNTLEGTWLIGKWIDIGECKHIISGYLKCIKSNRGTNDEACRKLAKDYLSCRMDKYVAPIPIHRCHRTRPITQYDEKSRNIIDGWLANIMLTNGLFVIGTWWHRTISRILDWSSRKINKRTPPKHKQRKERTRKNNPWMFCLRLWLIR